VHVPQGSLPQGQCFCLISVGNNIVVGLGVNNPGSCFQAYGYLVAIALFGNYNAVFIAVYLAYVVAGKRRVGGVKGGACKALYHYKAVLAGACKYAAPFIAGYRGKPVYGQVGVFGAYNYKTRTVKTYYTVIGSYIHILVGSGAYTGNVIRGEG
jgi:hypothetical protein